MVAMARAEADPAASAATWRAVRQRILAINKTDPDDPFPFILFVRSFAAEGAEPTANAVTGLLRAFELAPYDEGLRQTVGYRHLQDGKADAARTALAPIAYNPHGGERAAAMQAVIDALDSGGAPAALALWDRQKADEGKAGKEETKAGGSQSQGPSGYSLRARTRTPRAMRRSPQRPRTMRTRIDPGRRR
jgi:hypothetical protein